MLNKGIELVKDWTGKDQDKDKDLNLVLKESLRTRTRSRINITGSIEYIIGASRLRVTVSKSICTVLDNLDCSGKV